MVNRDEHVERTEPAGTITPSDHGRSVPRRALVGDDLAYVLPMAVFLLFTWVGGKWEHLYPVSYAAKTLLVAVLLVVLWRHFTRIRWDHWPLGVLVGVVGVVQWVGMEKLLLATIGDYHFLSREPFVPPEFFSDSRWMWSFVAVRLIGAALLVPVMEELFWRDFLWRSLIAPNDFKLADVGEWDPKAFWTVAVVFGAGVHVEWITAIAYGLLVGWLLVRTKSLGACIVAHCVTNLLLGAYVVVYQDWAFW